MALRRPLSPASSQRIPRVRHSLTRFLAVLTMFGALFTSLLSAVGVQAATFNLSNGDVAGLISAVGTAGANTINLAAGGAYNLTAVNNTTGGANGLPVIVIGANLTINGNGATIKRTGAPAFRFFNIATGGTLTLSGVTLNNGLAAGADGAGNGNGGDGQGGAILNSGTLTVTNSTFSSNSATGGKGGNGAPAGFGGEADGGAIFDSGATSLTVSGSTFSGNTATGGVGGNGTGGADANSGGGANGGAIENGNAPVTITNSTFSGNSVVGGNGGYGGPNGGGSAGAGRGGAIRSDNNSDTKALTMSGSTFDTNSAKGGTGGDGAVVAGNGAPGNGGAIYSTSGNSSDGIKPTVMATNSTFSANKATGGDGGLMGGVTGTGGDARGGAIDIGSNGSNALTLIFVTIANNTSTGGNQSGMGNGGGVDTETGNATVFGTLVAKNLAATAPNCLFSGNGGKPDTESYNLDFPLDATNPCGFTNHVQTTDPKLDTLKSNGGPTQTLALLAGSGAINTGGTSANNCPATDQRGFARPVGPACDIGAFEFNASGGSGSGLQYNPLSAPVRLADTRGLHAFRNPPTLTAGQTVNFPGHFTFDGVTVPAAAVALVGNATVDNSANPVAPGFATLYPSGGSLPLASNLNFVPGTVRPNEVTVALGADGTFNLYSSTGGNFVIDITGYYAPPTAGALFYHPLTAPVRELDTRNGASAFVHPNAALTAGQTLSLPASFSFAGITVPAGALALAGNATVDNSANPVAPGFATLYPGGQSLPATSTLNFVPGTVAPNGFIVGIGAGSYNLYSNTGGNFVIDITGYYDTNGVGGFDFYPLATPVRELDTRSGATAFIHPNAALTAGQKLNLPGSFTFAGITVPGGAAALLGNATVDNSANPVAPGFATIYPSGNSLPLASNLNFVAGTVAPNAFVVGLGADGTYNLYSNTGGQFVIDITGYFGPGAGTSKPPPGVGAPTPKPTG